MMKAMIPPQVGMRLRTLQKEKKKKKRRKAKKGKGQKKEKRERKKGAMLLSLFPHLCFKVAPCSSCSESHKLSFYTSGNFHYRTWLVYSYDGLPQMP